MASWPRVAVCHRQANNSTSFIDVDRISSGFLGAGAGMEIAHGHMQICGHLPMPQDENTPPVAGNAGVIIDRLSKPGSSPES
jgi:hypothetical protein